MNVGYLNSPFCVIYGFSAVAFAVFLPEIQNSLFFLFLGGVIIAGFIEYTSGKLLERIFGRKWWDYSDHRFHIGAMCAWRQRCFGVFVQCHGAVFQSTASSPDRTDPWADREDLPVGDRHCDRIGCHRFQRSGVPDALPAAETGAPGQL